MKWCNRSAAILSFLFLMFGGLAFAASEVLTFDNDELRERYAELTFQFRCPKCQNQNVADSNAPISVDIRQKTYEMLHQGYSDQDIVDFMVDRYTEFVIYKPQMSVVTIWLWVVPAIVLLSGLILLVRMTRSRSTGTDDELTDDDRARLKNLLEDKS